MQPTEVTLPTGKEYQLEYDDIGGLRSVVTPSLSKHHFHSVTLIGRQRHVYKPPGSPGVYIRDYDGSGRLVDERYPGEHRRIAYRYDQRGRLSSVYHDWIDSIISYDGLSEIVSNVSVNSKAGDPYSCTLRFERDSSLLTLQEVWYGSGPTGLVGATFRYSYKPQFSVSSIDATIGVRSLVAELIDYDESTGRRVRRSPFVFERQHVQREVIRDLNVEIVREFDARGVWLSLNFAMCSCVLQ